MLWTTKAFLLRFLSTILMISCSLIFFLVSLIRCTRLRFPFHFFLAFFLQDFVFGFYSSCLSSLLLLVFVLFSLLLSVFFVVAIFACLLSSISLRFCPLLSVSLFLSLLVTYFYWSAFLTSVLCFSSLFLLVLQ